MLMALTDLDCSSRYHQSILKEYNHLKPIVFLSGSRLSSRCIFHTHHYLQPSQIRTFFRLMPTDRIGTGENICSVAGKKLLSFRTTNLLRQEIFTN
ncbi:hypothetical protein DAX99_25475 [Salmonella enterica subsp. enterica]|nr:hypothetical protein [Salmonella enterica]EAA9597794.1 hypothetical protein [Salmonella enterica]PUO37793.1 hypothetical protein DAY10_25300 [Salmonella enterica subsp. enterica]PUO62588.1 hypothetical protein DAX55_19795 [Salmonella enterica subsp. enterica]PUQ10857.1 hypothetical protein DAX99_25475 [Salmonella enterica subsp. enterica]